MDAFKDNRFVWLAMLSIFPMTTWISLVVSENMLHGFDQFFHLCTSAVCLDFATRFAWSCTLSVDFVFSSICVATSATEDVSCCTAAALIGSSLCQSLRTLCQLVRLLRIPDWKIPVHFLIVWLRLFSVASSFFKNFTRNFPDRLQYHGISHQSFLLQTL